MENQYQRAVRAEGNPAACAVVDEGYEVCDRKWRGIGNIPRSGLRIRPELAAFDTARTPTTPLGATMVSSEGACAAYHKYARKGLLSAALIDKMIMPRFASPELARLEDQAVLDLPPWRRAFSTDTFVVSPIFFPGAASATWPSTAP